jgi:hypothetical protein
MADTPDRERPDRERPDRERPDRESPDRESPDQEMPDRDARDIRHRSSESEDSAAPNGQTAVSIREAAALTGRSEATIYHSIATGQLPAQPTASRGLSICPQDLERVGHHVTGSQRPGWSVQCAWDWIWQRGQATARRLRAGMRSLVPDLPGKFPGAPLF